jgi:nucleoside-diphosphate-sugar epimerase
MKLAVTGADGFVGTVLCRSAEAEGHEVVRVVRRAKAGRTGVLAIGEIDGRTDWHGALRGCETVIHLAARVHVMRERARDPLAAFRSVNVDGARRLAQAAAAQGIRRLLVVSTIKVLGERTTGTPLGPNNEPAPADPYAQSKLEGEIAVQEVSCATGLETVIVRPPLVSGPGVGGNLRRIMGLVQRGVPLPFKGIENRRSLVSVHNLASVLLQAAREPGAAGQKLLVADQPALSTADLVRLIAHSMGRRPLLWSVPPGLLRFAGRMVGRGEEVERLVSSLEVDDRETRTLLRWTPPWTTEEGIRAMVAAFGMERGS